MATLLHLQCSPTGPESTTQKVADAFLAAYEATSPDDEIVELDLWSAPLPELDATFVAAQNKIIAQAEQSPAEREVWGRVQGFCEQLASADKVLVSCPMWNFSIPYRLKHYLDVVLQPGLTFLWTPQDGYRGLLPGRRVQLVLTRAGEYTPPAANAWMDHQTSYLKFIFEFVGITDIRTLAVEPTMLQGPEVAAQRIAGAVEAAKDAGATF